MKLFHLGDLHIGKLVNGYSMEEDQRFVIEQVYEAIEKEKPDVILVAGDIFDRSVPSVTAVELLNEIFGRIVFELKTPIIAIAGNHDSNERIEYLSAFTKYSGLHIVGTLKQEAEKITLQDEFGDVHFFPIPFVQPPVVRDFYGEETIRTHQDAMEAIMKRVREQMNPSERNVVIAHGHISVCNNGIYEELVESDSEKMLSIGGTELISANVFDGVTYTALGHLHGPQKVGSDRIRYAGSLLKYSFSEVNQKKGITMIEMDKDGELEITLLPFSPRRDVRIIRGELADILANPEGNQEDYVRVELYDQGEIMDPMGKIKSVYPNAMELSRVQQGEEKERTSSIAQVKGRTKIELFSEFHQDICGNESNEDLLAHMNELIFYAEKGEN